MLPTGAPNARRRKRKNRGVKKQGVARAERFRYRVAMTSGLSALDAPLGSARTANGHVAEWLRTGLQNRVRRFNSGRGLH